MDLVVDASILFASLIRDNITAELLFKDEIIDDTEYVALAFISKPIFGQMIDP